jgi:DNA (cytosine-5)-methyltransferase 1
MNFYNEIDSYAAQWLRNLIDAGHIAPGVVDERSVEEITPNELRQYNQCHFFAGIGVWSYALRLAGVPDDFPIWTGSCPCQPFSAAGKGAGFADERHLWPAFHHLIEQCQPPVVLGEQVASKDADPWIDLVHADLEALGYAFGAVPFPSASVGAPHIRDRLYWVADADSNRLTTRDGIRLYGEEHDAEHGGSSCAQWPGPTNGNWRDADWLYCRDGKWRPVEPGTFPLAHGAAARVGRLRAYGNAINAIQAQAFIEAALGC